MAPETVITGTLSGRIESEYVSRSLADEVVQLNDDVSRREGWALFLAGTGASSLIALTTSPEHPLPLIIVGAVLLAAALVLYLVTRQDRGRLTTARTRMGDSANVVSFTAELSGASEQPRVATTTTESPFQEPRSEGQ